jgi:hypothetical protein
MDTDTVEFKAAEARMLRRSQTGIAHLCNVLQAIIPDATIRRDGCDFAAILSDIAWVGTYTEIGSDNHGYTSRALTVRRVDRQSRRVQLRGGEAFESVEEAETFMREIISPTPSAVHPPGTAECAKEEIRAIARSAVRERIEAGEVAADQRAIASIMQ